MDWKRIMKKPPIDINAMLMHYENMAEQLFKRNADLSDKNKRLHEVLLYAYEKLSEMPDGDGVIEGMKQFLDIDQNPLKIPLT